MMFGYCTSRPEELTEVHLTRFQTFMEEFGAASTIPKGEYVFRQGERDSCLYLIRSGLLKAHYLDLEGKEHIKSFLPEGSIIGSLVALIDKDPSSFSLAAVEPSDIVSVPYETLAQAAQQDVGLANALVGFLTGYGKRKERREFELLTLSPEQRYGLLLQTSPEVAERVSQADLAAYIGVTPQALSRIKRRRSNRP